MFLEQERGKRQLEHLQSKSDGTLITLKFSLLMFHSNVRVGRLALQHNIGTEVEDLRLELRFMLELSNEKMHPQKIGILNLPPFVRAFVCDMISGHLLRF